MITTLNEMQSIRAGLLQQLNYDVTKARECFDFIIGNEEAPTHKEATSKAYDLLFNDACDIYYVLMDGSLTSLENAPAIKNSVVGVAVKKGDKIATVALDDAYDGEEIKLAIFDECGSSEFFYRDIDKATSDWRGEDNTDDYGEALNDNIGLLPNQYIPSIAQLVLIRQNAEAVNAALEAVGGSPLRQAWYWSSTEYSSTSAWYIFFQNGHIDYSSKRNPLVVRPAVRCKLSTLRY
jgi:hypothetical protein